MQGKKILILIGVFLASLPISYLISAYAPWASLIGHALIRLGAYWVTAADIGYISSTILTSLFFTLIAWLLLKAKKESSMKGVA